MRGVMRNWLSETMKGNPSLMERISLVAEAQIYLNGNLNSKMDIYWSSSKPHKANGGKT